MARLRDVTKWLTGFIGYASYPRPDVLRQANRLAVARDVWISGTKGIGQRRGGMSLAKTLVEPISSFVTVPALVYDRMQSMALARDATTNITTSAAGAVGAWHTWTWAYGDFIEAIAMNQKAFLTPSVEQAIGVIDIPVASMDAPAAPTAANTGVGAYAATLRYYRVQWYANNALQSRGPVSPALSFTPSGAGTGVIVTRPAAPTDHVGTDWYLWGSADDRTYYKLATVAWATTTYTDTTAPSGYSGVGAALTDTLLSTPARLMGMAASGVPSVANTGAGAYAAVARSYRVRWNNTKAGVVTRRGEPSSGVAFTPSGGGTAARVTRPTLPSGEYDVTHWELEVSLDTVNWYLLATVSSSTTTYDDSAATSTYSAGTVSDTIGDFTIPPACRSMAADRDRLLFAGGYTPGTYSRVWYTPVLGTDVGDEERVPTDNYFDIEAQDDDEIKAIIGPIGGSMLVFKRRSLFRLIRTGDADAPYEVIKVTEGVGCDGPGYVCLAPTESSSEAAYFINTSGAWRYDVSGGITRLNDDLSPPWDGQTSNLGRVVAYLNKGCVLFGEYAYNIATGGWMWQDWTHGQAQMQATMRVNGLEQPYLMMPSTGATEKGLYIADASVTTDIDQHAFVAEIRTNRFTLTETTQRWRPVRLRLWGNGGTLACKAYIGSRDTAAGLTALTTVAFTLGTQADGVDFSALAMTGPVEYLALGFEDSGTASAWELDAVEVTGIPQEPVP